MLEMIDIGIEEAVAYRVGGKVTEEEMTSGISMFKESIEKDCQLRKKRKRLIS
jgi:hypothetical protein